MHKVKVKSILSSNNGMNTYRGCSHGCIYCDSRSKCYNMDHDFEDIEVKENAPELLELALKSKRKPCMVSTGSMCDPYLHLEEGLCITQKCLNIIYKYGCGVCLLTKSDRILRDLPLIDKINKNTKAVVQMTLTTYDDELCIIIEPNVCNTSSRVKVLLKCKQLGIPTVVWMCPILPFINDSKENIEGLMKYCIEANVKGIVLFDMGVTLREGDREYFYSKLDENFPLLKEKYIRTFGDAYACNSPNAKQLMDYVVNECIAHNIMYKPDEVFAYLREFPVLEEQLSLL